MRTGRSQQSPLAGRGTGQPRSPDVRPNYHEALRAAHEVHTARMAQGTRRHRVSLASAGGFLVFAGLVGGLVAASHAVWSSNHRSAEAGASLMTEMFSVRLPSTPSRSDSPEVVLGTVTQLTRWMAATTDVEVTVLTIDTEVIAPGDAADPARAAAMLDGMQSAMVSDVVRVTGATVSPTVELAVSRNPARQSMLTDQSGLASVTTVMHGSTLVSVVCTGTGPVLPAECRAVLDSLSFH